MVLPSACRGRSCDGQTSGGRPRVTRTRGRVCLWRVTRDGRSFVRPGVSGDVVDRPCTGLPRSRRGDDRACCSPARSWLARPVCSAPTCRLVAAPAVDPATAVDADALVVAPVRQRGPLARAPRPPVRRRSQRRRGPRAGGVHPAGPQRRTGRATRLGRRRTCARSCSTWRATRTDAGWCRCATAPRSPRRRRRGDDDELTVREDQREVLDALRDLPGAPAHVPRAALLRRARPGRHRRDAGDLAQLASRRTCSAAWPPSRSAWRRRCRT